MKWDLFWAVIYAYKRGLINREEFIRHWGAMQKWENGAL
jgi:hypothetical protein